MLKREYKKEQIESSSNSRLDNNESHVKATKLYKFFYSLMGPLLRNKFNSWIFLGMIIALTWEQ